MFLLSLSAALAGTPLRQAEAAGDFARSVAEIGLTSVLDDVDGGVGDDPGDTLKADAPTVPSALAPAEFGPACGGFSLAFVPASPASEPDRASRPSSPARRRALLQRFLF